ncbi:MAG: DUF5678 domain-containing protein [Candidatus ainarchaeum sp.]|nr:DUF5678 domain-containing protein [Candidatus ainarchaeum sp.]
MATPDFNQYNAYANADLSKYAGEWIALIGSAVVAHGKDFKELLARVKKEHPAETPFIAKIPAKEILIW